MLPLARRIADATADVSECRFWCLGGDTLFLPTIVVNIPHGYIASATHNNLFIRYFRFEVVVCITFAPSVHRVVATFCGMQMP
jgi:hypothetical protein